MSELIRVGITHGDVNGISYEILLYKPEQSQLEGETTKPNGKH